MSVLGPDVATAAATVRSAAAGDELAFAGLVAAHHAAMSRVAYVICGDPETTRDVVQAAWAKAWRRLPSLRDPAQVRSWLVAIAANEARQSVRRRRRDPVRDISTELDRQGGGLDPTSSDDLVDLRGAIHGLTPDERALLAMRFVAGLESPEIAGHLGMTASGVRSRLARIIERLRVDLAIDREGSR